MNRSERGPAPLVLLQAGHDTWCILGPGYNYGRSATFPRTSEVEDRRYEELAVVHGDLRTACERLAQLEKGRPEEMRKAIDQAEEDEWAEEDRPYVRPRPVPTEPDRTC